LNFIKKFASLNNFHHFIGGTLMHLLDKFLNSQVQHCYSNDCFRLHRYQILLYGNYR